MSAYSKVMKMTPQDWLDYITTDTCCICKFPIRNEQGEEVEIELDTLVPINEEDVLPHRSETGKTDKVRHHYHGDQSVSFRGGNEPYGGSNLFYEPARWVHLIV
jgi:hypothetical protein